jgi:hypothetical protein
MRLAGGGSRIRTLGPPPSPSLIPRLQAKTSLRGDVGADREPETWYQGPAAIRCVTESRGGMRKVW